MDKDEGSKSGWFFGFMIGLFFGLGPCTPSSCKIDEKVVVRTKIEERVIEPYWVEAKNDLNGDGVPDIVLSYHGRPNVTLYSHNLLGNVDYRK